MRILLSITGIVFVLILGILVIVSLLPKRHIVWRSASFHATPERLFFLIAGPQDWRPDVLRCEAVHDAGGRELMRETTRKNETITYEVLDRVPSKSLKRRIATEKLPYAGTWTYSLQPEGGITVVRITEDGEVYNPVFRFMSLFVLGNTRTMDAYLRALGKSTGEDIEVKD
jgi:hypothetical protein